MKTTNDDWIRIECQHCLYHKSNADMENVQSTCKRLDHKHLRFAKPVFKCYDCEDFKWVHEDKIKKLVGGDE